ncbi:MAG: EamA family transporter [Pseudomonadota bacterium]
MALTLGAAFLQNVRSLLQKRLTGTLSVNGATYVRFLYAVPFAWLYAAYLWWGDSPGFTTLFWVYVLFAATAQIAATAALLGSFTTGNFAVGTAFSKTEAAQAAVFGLVILGDTVSGVGLAGIAISLVGVILLSGTLTIRQLLRPDRQMWLGLAAAAGFAISAVGFRGASLGLDDGTYLERAGLTVAVAVSLQTILMGGYLLAFEPGELRRTLGQYRVAVWVGLIGMVASVGWFTAMTLKNAAVVRAVGQVELLFTLITSVWLLKEKIKLREIVGIVCVVLGIILLI